MTANKQTEAAVMKVFLKFFEAYAAGDLDTAMGTLVQDPDVVFLGTGQDERRIRLLDPLEVQVSPDLDF